MNRSQIESIGKSLNQDAIKKVAREWNRFFHLIVAATSAPGNQFDSFRITEKNQWIDLDCLGIKLDIK